MYILEDHHLIYLAHPRTASYATAGVLMDRFGARMVGSHHSGLEERPPAGWMVATTIRNPYDVMVSWWRKMDRGNLSLNDFIEEWYTHTKYCPEGRLFGHVLHANYIIRYEEIQHEFDWLLTWAGLVPADIPQMNSSPYRGDLDFSEFYKEDPEALDLVSRLFDSEIRQNGYRSPV
jgi:hypothetical protein